jgi:hypothetical protein
MRLVPFFASAFLFAMSLNADLADSCSLTSKTACVLNSDQTSAEFLVMLPNYTYCGVKFVADTYPTASLLADFQAGLYVTAGPRWDLITEQTGSIVDNLIYPVGPQPLFATFFNVYTRNGQSLNDYVHAKLATTYRANPTVMLIAVPCKN